MAKVLIIDSERSIRNTLRERLEYEGYSAEVAEDYQHATMLADKTAFDVVLCNEAFFNEQHSHNDNPSSLTTTPTILVSDHSTVDAAVDAMSHGATSFLTKPIDLNKLLNVLREIVSHECDNPNTKHANYEPQIRNSKRKAPKVEVIIGESRRILHVNRLIDKVAPSEARVLITGANGTGKELVARWLHEKSHRCEGPFIEVNCAAIPSELIESELFGHEKGAFTSAIKQRKGKFEQADGGTLFLDEIGDMSLSAQAKVLRALQENKISRVGSDKDLDVNVRVVAATNKNLQNEIMHGNFREDLYHRLSVIVIQVPALSDRLDDIPLLVDYFIDKISAEYQVDCKSIEPEAVDELKKMGWSGNIRELRNVIERLIILSGNSITLDDVRMYAMGVV